MRYLILFLIVLSISGCGRCDIKNVMTNSYEFKPFCPGAL